MKKKYIIIIGLQFALFSAHAQDINNSYIKKIVKEIATIYETQYTFPSKGFEVGKFLRGTLDEGELYDIPNYELLASTLKDHIFSITNDPHAAVIARKPPEPGETPNQPSINSFLSKVENYGFTDLKIIDKEIGYVKVLVFFPIRFDEKALSIADETMQKFSKCSSIIFDLTACSGGDPNMITHITTYLFPEGKKVHLNDFYYRPNDNTTSSYTKEKVNGTYLDNTDVYVLTSKKTFSAGEEFAYNLKHLNRATLIGEPTGGGAHTVEPRVLDEKMELMVPTGRAINPITKTNWEGKGVIPHISVPADNALDKALEVIDSKLK